MLQSEKLEKSRNVYMHVYRELVQISMDGIPSINKSIAKLSKFAIFGILIFLWVLVFCNYNHPFRFVMLLQIQCFSALLNYYSLRFRRFQSN